MAGLYIISDPATEDKLNLPSGDFDIPLVFQDKALNENGEIAFPNATVPFIHPNWSSDTTGNFLLVNGKV